MIPFTRKNTLNLFKFDFFVWIFIKIENRFGWIIRKHIKKKLIRFCIRRSFSSIFLWICSSSSKLLLYCKKKIIYRIDVNQICNIQRTGNFQWLQNSWINLIKENIEFTKNLKFVVLKLNIQSRLSIFSALGKFFSASYSNQTTLPFLITEISLNFHSHRTVARVYFILLRLHTFALQG